MLTAEYNQKRIWTGGTWRALSWRWKITAQILANFLFLCAAEGMWGLNPRLTHARQVLYQGATPSNFLILSLRSVSCPDMSRTWDPTALPSQVAGIRGVCHTLGSLQSFFFFLLFLGRWGGSLASICPGFKLWPSWLLPPEGIVRITGVSTWLVFFFWWVWDLNWGLYAGKAGAPGWPQTEILLISVSKYLGLRCEPLGPYKVSWSLIHKLWLGDWKKQGFKIHLSCLRRLLISRCINTSQVVL
jgi:hypothetical protein